MTLAEIKELIEVFDKSGLGRLEIENEGFSVAMEKNHAVVSHQSIPHAPQHMLPQIETRTVEAEQREAPKPKAEGATIKAPMIGTFYRSPSPSASAYVNVGDRVKKGQTLAIIEAMKIMNEIEAEFDCKILEIVPADGQPVEFDSPLFIVERL